MIEKGAAPPRAGVQRKAACRLGRRLFVFGAAAGLSVALAGSAAAATAGERRLALYSPHTDEHFRDVYWQDGRYVPASLARINWLMRDFHKELAARMDPQLLDLLHAIHARLGTRQPISILSGFRTPATNRLLRIEGFATALHSLHLQAQAADIMVEHVSLSHLRRVALSLRAGGVGTYWADDFIHVDVGPLRTW